jgi:hypothetical protein
MNKKKALVVCLLLFVLLFSIYFLVRNVVLHNIVNKVVAKLADHELELKMQHAGFEGLSGVVIEDISLSPIAGAQLLSIKKINCSFSILQLLKGNYPIDDLTISHGFVHLVRLPDSSKNYTALLHFNKQSVESQNETKGVNFASVFNNAWKTFSKLTSIDMLVEDFELSYSTPDNTDQLLVNRLSIQNAGFNFEAIDLSNKSNNSIHIIGTINPGNGIVQFHGSSPENATIYFPFIKKLVGLEIFSKTFGGKLVVLHQSSEQVGINVQAAINYPGINHWRIGPEDVILDSLGMNLNINISPHSLSVDSVSYIIINALPITFESTYTSDDSTRIQLKACFNKVESTAFFNSLPKGLFNSVNGIKTTGKLTYNLNFDVTTENPNELVFESALKKDQFSILSYGNENFSYINKDFTYEARENDKIVQIIDVSSQNSFFTPLSEISPLLINCVLISEDGTYFFHKGFNEEAFRVSMATNIKEKRFARGGSTITMQLVKNIFLIRNKTISRKVEEALIVWLIENQRIVSKERMLEVYLNIIEWGPGIYGIGEASKFYFNKKPSELNMSECIYLSSIIPRPKYFKYSFEADGSLKSYLKNYFDVVAGRLLKKEIIDQETFEKLSYQVDLKGAALQFVVPPDSLPVDSLIIDNAGDLY